MAGTDHDRAGTARAPDPSLRQCGRKRQGASPQAAVLVRQDHRTGSNWPRSEDPETARARVADKEVRGADQHGEPASGLGNGRRLRPRGHCRTARGRCDRALGKQPAAAGERRPIRPDADQAAERWPGGREYQPEVERLGLDQTKGRPCHGGRHATQDAGGDLEGGRVGVRDDGARLLDRQLRAEPEGATCVSGQQHAELVLAADDVLGKDPLPRLGVEAATDQLVNPESQSGQGQ